MREQSTPSLEGLAEQDPVARPLARLQLVALDSAADPTWDEIARTLQGFTRDSRTPALHGQRIEVDSRMVGNLVGRLRDTLATAGESGSDGVPVVVSDDGAIRLLGATLDHDSEEIAAIAAEFGADPGVVGTIGQCAALPLLLASGRRFGGERGIEGWEPGYCPVCGGWPLLAEQRGLGKSQWLRCGRCATAWTSRHQRCVYCENTDYETLGYMAPEDERESRRAVTCDRCKGYLKVFATVTSLQAEDLLRLDLQSLELDIAAIDAGYARPERPGFRTGIELIPTQPRIRRWLPWQ